MKRVLIAALLLVLISGCSGNSIRLIGNSDNKKAVDAVEIQDMHNALSPSRDEFFINPDYGWKATYEYIGMFKEEMVLYKTVDGGKTWTEIANTKDRGSTLPSGSHPGMFFIDPNKGWITSNTPSEGTVGLYVTTDGGVTWNKQKLQIPEKLHNTEIDSFPPIFFSPSDGMILTFPAADSSGADLLLYITHDGGEEWTPVLNKYSGTSGEIGWSFKSSNSVSCEATYHNSNWTFDGSDWIKKDK